MTVEHGVRGFIIVGVVEYWSDGFGNGLYDSETMSSNLVSDRLGPKPNTPSPSTPLL